jgi:hypothetical protein
VVLLLPLALSGCRSERQQRSRAQKILVCFQNKLPGMNGFLRWMTYAAQQLPPGAMRNQQIYGASLPHCLEGTGIGLLSCGSTRLFP